MSGVRKKEQPEYVVDESEQFMWSVFIACCMISSMGMFVIAAIEWNIH